MSFPVLVGGAGTIRTDDSNYFDWSLIGNDFTSDDWKEAVALYSPSQLSIGGKRSRATLTGYVPFEKLQQAILWIMGFSWVDANGYLRRNVPACHPILNNLFANEIIECAGVKWLPPKLPKNHPWSWGSSRYFLAKLVIGYSQPPFDILSDADLLMTNPIVYRGQELRRWCSWSPKPYVDLLEMPGGSEKFDAPGQAFDGKPTFNSRLLIRAQKSTMRLVWHDLPLDFIADPYGHMPKIEAAIGKINSDDFFGTNNAHTWLLDDVDVVGQNVYADPIASNAKSLNLENNTTGAFSALARRCDLIFTFKHFSPTNGKAGSTEKGWRLRPAFNGSWYPATNTIGGGVTLPEDTEFQKLFTHWSDT